MNTRVKFNIITTLIILALYGFSLGLGIFVNNILNKTAYSLLNTIYAIQLNIEYENWDITYNELDKLNTEWSKIEKYWSMLINHQEIDEISANLRIATEYIKCKDKINSLSSLAVLERYIEHIPELDKVSLENIF
ncbi:MAG: DUF4363 family protein [Clostridiales bacterium]|nr:DUF4363 family protein [Clostridiales bacterium]